jgi:hypothetical protein
VHYVHHQVIKIKQYPTSCLFAFRKSELESSLSHLIFNFIGDGQNLPVIFCGAD